MNELLRLFLMGRRGNNLEPILAVQQAGTFIQSTSTY